MARACEYCGTESDWGLTPLVEGINYYVCMRCSFILPLKLFWLVFRRLVKTVFTF